MRGKFVLAHDLGTTGNKASLYDQEGKVVASAFAGYPVEYLHPTWAEQNPENWWRAVCQSSRQLIAATGIPPEEIACLSFSGQMMGLVPVDTHARPLRNAIIWADQRAVAEAQAMVAALGMEEIYALTGHRASPSYTGPKILWLRNHQPEIFAQTHKFLQAKDFIAARLTGSFATDYSDASGTILYDLKNWTWSEQILDAVHIDADRLPDLHASTDVIGQVLKVPAEEAGLAPGTPVVIGGGDGCCASTGAGVVREGSAYNYIGSSSWIALATREPVFDATMRTFTFAHVVPDMFCPCGTMQAAGGAYQWLRDLFAVMGEETPAGLMLEPYDLMDREAESSPPGARGLFFLPYLLGERSPHWNPNARGAFIGLNMRHNRADVFRAALEGITFNLRIILDAFQAQGARVEAMRVIGGGASGRVWRQILADVYNLPVVRPALLEEATSLGAAIVGGIGVGLYKDFSLAEKLTPIVDTVQPDSAHREVYDRLYKIFCQAYPALVPIYEMLVENEGAF